MNSQNAGWHLLIDAHVDEKHANLLNDEEFLRKGVLDVVDLLDMEILEDPLVRKVPVDPSKLWSTEDEGGISVMCMITTSHISIHAWPVRQRFSMDVFSCKPFKADVVDDFVRERFHVTTRWRHMVQRIWPQGEFEPHRAPKPAEPIDIPERK